jgi:hypothetical protein
MDVNTFLTTVYVLVEDQCVVPADPPQPGPAPALSRGETLTLAIFSQWAPFGSERAFYRWASRHLRVAFPTLPTRPQFNRLLRRWHDALVVVGLQVADWVEGRTGAFQVLDSMGLVTRNSKRRGRGWLAGQATKGWCSRVGWFAGLRLLSVVSPHGAITGYGLAPANAGERALAEVLLAARATPHPALPTAGHYTDVPYLADAGFNGRTTLAAWRGVYGATVLAPPQPHATDAWPADTRRWHAGLRQIIETVHDRLLATFRLASERPHCLRGIQARLAAKVALHNLCLWLNLCAGRPLLEIADFIAW